MRSAGMAAAVLLAATAFGAEPTSGVDAPRCDVAPGWAQTGAARMYSADTLYDYMDGNSEGYLIYGFLQMHGVTCQSGDAAMVVDISEMADAESAWGLFASNRDPRLPVETIGVSGQVVPQRGIAVRGNRFVEISASPASADHTAAIRGFLIALVSRIDGVTTPPDPVTWFPAEGLDPASIRLIPESVLGLSVLKRGYLAQYNYGRAIVAPQASVDAAVQVLAKLRRRFGDARPAATADEAIEATDKYLGRLLFFRKGAVIGGLANLNGGFDGALAARTLAAKLP